MELCPSYRPWHDKRTGQTFLKPAAGKCLHYYFYFIDPELGLCYLRVPTWAPFRLQLYCNGHNLLAARLRKRGISYEMVDNAFVDIADFSAAQKLADDLHVSRLHRALDRCARLYCPILKPLQTRYHWSLMQVEYATDLIFTNAQALATLYEPLTRTAIHAVKAEHVATFLGRKLSAHFPGELGTDFTTRLQGTRIKHHMGPVSIKMYDKFGRILRIETTANNVGFFKHHRQVEQKDGRRVVKLAPVRKTIYSLAPDLQQLLLAANLRSLAFLSDLDDPSAGIKALRKVCEPVRQQQRPYRGFNFFCAPDQRLFELLARGELCISGVRNKDLRLLSGKTTAQISYLFKRLRLHGLVKKIGRTYKYSLTEFGRHVILTGLKLKNLFLIPALATPPAAH
ncbi:MAG: winged helix-turn-helix domain-containing protein [Candidatus Binatia bacterium]